MRRLVPSNRTYLIPAGDWELVESENLGYGEKAHRAKKLFPGLSQMLSEPNIHSVGRRNANCSGLLYPCPELTGPLSR